MNKFLMIAVLTLAGFSAKADILSVVGNPSSKCITMKELAAKDLLSKATPNLLDKQKVRDYILSSQGLHEQAAGTFIGFSIQTCSTINLEDGYQINVMRTFE